METVCLKYGLMLAGYRQACDAAKERLEALALNRSKDQQAFRQDLLNIAKTTLRWIALPCPALPCPAVCLMFLDAQLPALCQYVAQESRMAVEHCHLQLADMYKQKAGQCCSNGILVLCSSKILTQDKELFAELAVDAVLRLKGSSNLESIHIIKKAGGTLKVSLAVWAVPSVPDLHICLFHTNCLQTQTGMCSRLQITHLIFPQHMSPLMSSCLLVTACESTAALVTCMWWAQESYLDEGFILDKRIGVGQPKRIENAKILVANTAMDTDKIKIYGARVRVDSMTKVSPCPFSELHMSAIMLTCVHQSSWLARLTADC